MINGKKVVALIQARCSSSRLPRKHLRKIGDKTLIDIVVNRLREIDIIDEIVISTTNHFSDKPLVKYARVRGINIFCFDGDINDVVGRHCNAVKKFKGDYLVVISGDCPLIDEEYILKQLNEISKGYDYIRPMQSCLREGIDTYSKECFELIDEKSISPYERENFGIILRENPSLINVGYIDIEEQLREKSFRLSVDNMADLRFMNEIYKELQMEGKEFDLINAVELVKRRPELKEYNSHIQQKAKGEKTYKILIKTEASEKIGLGHLRRMLVLGKYLNENKNNGVFYALNDDRQAVQLLEAEGYIYDYKIADGFELIEIAKDYNADILIIDVKDLNEGFVYDFERIKKETSVKKLVLVDNYVQDKNVDLFIFPGIQNKMNSEFDSRIISGIETVFIKDTFVKARNKRTSKEEIAICFGGTDIYNVTTEIIKLLKAVRIDENYFYKIVSGPYFKFEEALNEELIDFPYSYEIIKNPVDIAEVFKNARLGIIYYGVTFYEFKYLGIPTIDVIPGEKYVEEFSKLEKMGLGHSIGVYLDLNKELLEKYLNSKEEIVKPDLNIGDMEGLAERVLS